MTDAIEMARDSIGLKGIDYYDEGKEFPQASSYDQAIKMAKANTEIFDYSQGIITLVDVDFSVFIKRHDNRKVKKNCTIPYYLNVAAEKEGINFSNVLQEALLNKLGLS